MRWSVALLLLVLCIGKLPARPRVESWEDVFRSWFENEENVLEFVCGTEGLVVAASFSLAASSGDLVMPSMKRMKRSP